ncbi:MAG: hypothetical protein DCC67_04960 [Planctomycetota bacterium]|nr:MAG: hypothetical protein DCC67_04960 [Planctomycetota bacterium]
MAGISTRKSGINVRPCAAICLLLAGLAPAAAGEPRVLLDGCVLELAASEPDVVTPIGMAFDASGSLLVLESQTHHRPEGYAGPAGDRIRRFADGNGDGRLDQWSTFAEGYQQGTNICVRPDGQVYMVTRRDVRLLHDSEGDGRSDQETPVLTLDTATDYPHNGLGGIALAPALGGDGAALYIGLGENFAGAYTLRGSDGSSYSDRGGAGTVFRTTPDGGRLVRYATGFWNPFGLCGVGGRLFCVDNDPDSSPPCRLIEVLPAADYGFRYEYFRPGTHPLQCWNGELPGTLPMICGTGEAPTAVVAHRGYLWVTSWGDHRIERYELSLADSGFYTAKRVTVVQGDADFRPTGMAVAPDGSIYFGDWVKLNYEVHGRGRIWRLQLPPQMAEGGGVGDPAAPRAPVAGQLQVFQTAAAEIPQTSPAAEASAVTLAQLQSLRWHRKPIEATLRAALRGDDPDVRMYAVRWIAEERMGALRDEVARLLDGPIPTERYFLVVLAALDWLDGDGQMKPAAVSDLLLLRQLQNESRSADLHALALRLISPDDGWLTGERMAAYLKSTHAPLRQAAVRTLAVQTRPERLPLLAAIAADPSEDAGLRADAVAGLATAASAQADLLARLAADPAPAVAGEASRVLRLTGQHAAEDEAKPDVADLDAWQRLLSEGGDAERGRRLFFMAAGPRCAVCHQFGGRGGRVGPDLTHIGRQQSRERIVASILLPSADVAPHFQPWTVVTGDGLARLGLRAPEAGDDGEEIYIDPNGEPFRLKSDEIAIREPSDKSIMPDGLERTLSIDDLRDVVALLSGDD